MSHAVDVPPTGTGTDPTRAGTSTDPTRAAVWRSAKGPLAVAVILVLVALVLALLQSGGSGDALDPRAAGRQGSKALAEVLRANGVQVRLVQTTDEAVAAAGPDTTVLVTTPGLLVAEQLRRVADTEGDLVLVAPGQDALDALAPEVTLEGTGGQDEDDPSCEEAVAVRAGRADAGGRYYTAPSSAAVCYPDDGAGSLVRLEVADRTVTVLGTARPLTNDGVDDAGNAALTLGLLGARPDLVWYLPSLTDVPEGAQRSFLDLLPDGVLFGAVQLLLAVVLLALWRGRRLGPVVAEPLPVVVPATEAVRGRARLYLRAQARDRAADTLREGTRTRLVAALGLPRGAPPGTLVDAVASRTGRPPDEVGAALFGPTPADDPALVHLARTLPALETEVRRP